MAIQDYEFTPSNGWLNAEIFKDEPTESEVRDILNLLHLQMLGFLNDYKDKLALTTSGSSGAENVGSAPISGVTGATVYAQLANIYSQIQGLALGGIPDGSITDVKLDNAENAIKDILVKLNTVYPTTHIDNAYSVTMPNVTSYTDGVFLCAKFDADSTDTITINVNSLGAKNVVDSSKNAVTIVKANTIYNMRYEATTGNFQLLGKGGGGNATAGDLLLNKTATVDGGPITGTLNLTGTATAGDLIFGKTMYNTDAKTPITGTLALTGNASASDVVSGTTFYNTDSKTKVAGTLALTGDATTDDVIAGKTFYNDNAKTKRTGTGTQRKYKSGTYTSIAGSNFINSSGSVDGVNTGKVVVSGLGFTPTMIIIKQESAGAISGIMTTTLFPVALWNGNVNDKIQCYYGGGTTGIYRLDGTYAIVTNDGFTLPVKSSGVSFTWYAVA